MSDLVRTTERGLYCEAGGFHVDPWTPVERALITHAHSDHARWGCGAYLCAAEGEGVLRVRVGADARIETLPYGQTREVNGVRVSFHPAGHVLGSAQIRLEHRGEVWVISGDYKRQADPTCTGFEPVRCHTFVTESTFGLPIYRWPSPQEVFDNLNAWWRSNRERGWTSVLFTYALGKSQRVLAGLDPSIGPIVVHGTVRRFLPAYAAAGVQLPEVTPATLDRVKYLRGRAMVIAPQITMNSPWLRKFAPVSTAMVSGWMRVRAGRRWRSIDRGFILSDHVDWDDLLATIRETGAERVGVTHGFTGPVVRWLREQGQDAFVVPTRYGDEDAEEFAGTSAGAADSAEEMLL